MAVARCDRQPSLGEARVLPARILEAGARKGEEICDVLGRDDVVVGVDQHHRHLEPSDFGGPIIVPGHPRAELVEELRDAFRLRPVLRRDACRSLGQLGGYLRVDLRHSFQDFGMQPKRA